MSAQPYPDAVYGAHPDHHHHHGHKAVSWQAVAVGGLAAVATSLVLFTLGSGLGLSMVSPYANEGVTATTFTVSAVVWLIVVQWLSSGLGGYMAGRLRNRWEGLHGDEVFFRDSAHGFAAWALASVLTASVLITSVTAVLGAGTQAASVVAAGKASEETSMTYGYDIDGLFRGTTAASAGTSDAVRLETNTIVMRSLKTGVITPTDQEYLADLVASRTNLSEAEAEERVDALVATVEKAKATADETRKAAAKFSILVALSMVIGAFIASVTAILGGRCRDEF